jgi:hypothetical protein
MILVKSLIVLFSILLFYYLYNTFIQTTKKCPGIEGFEDHIVGGKLKNNNNNNNNNNNKTPEIIENIEEEKFTQPSILEKHNISAQETKMINDLQLKLNDLIKLSNEANKIKI